MIDISYGDKTYNDPYLVFDRKLTIEEYIAHEIQPTAKIKAKDYVDFNTSKENSNTFIHNVDNLVIETPSNANFTNDTYLLSLKDNKLWRVASFITKDDNTMKQYSLRPRKKTVLTLISSGD